MKSNQILVFEHLKRKGFIKSMAYNQATKKLSINIGAIEPVVLNIDKTEISLYK